MPTKNFLSFMICCVVLFLSGCTVTMTPQSKSGPEGRVPDALVPTKPLIDLSKVTIGNSIDDVKSKLGEDVIIGYTIKHEGEIVPITQKSLQKEETVKAHGFTYQVLYYFTFIVRPDDQITDDELTPLVFENGVLIGKTWDEFNKIKSSQ